MNGKDYFRIACLLLYKEKKKFFYTFIIFLGCATSIAILLFNRNVETLLDKGLANIIGFRTLCVSQRDQFDDIDEEKRIEKDLNDLLSINHVVDAYEGNYRETIITKSDFANESLDGTITLLRGTSKTLPNIVAGRGFEDGEKGVAICPVWFYPTSNPTLVNSEELIDGTTLLGKTFEVKYSDYTRNSQNGELIENQTYSKKFKIIGLYDVSDRFNDNGTCYISAQDMDEIVSTKSSWEKEQNYNGIKMFHNLDVVVDSIDNVDYVIEQINNLGFDMFGFVTSIDMEYINFIRLATILILSITLFTIIFVIHSYIKKMLNSEEKNIAVLRTSGYSRTTICNIYALKILINNFIIFIAGTIIISITFLVLKYNFPYFVGANLIMGGIDMYVFPFLFSFFITVIFPTIITRYSISKKCKLKIAELVESVE